MIISIIKRGVRGFLESNGYYLQQRVALPYGLDYMLDIERLCRAWNFSVLTFFDVGANWGETSTRALTRFPGARIFAFEPSAGTFARLRGRLGKEPRFSPHNIALGEACGEVAFFEYESSFYNSLVPNPPQQSGFSPTARETVVPCSTIDAFCEKHKIGHIDVLKVDAERCDLWVLRGARNMFAGDRIRFVYFEFNNAVPAPDVQESALVPISEFLAPFGFRFVATYIDRIETNPMFLIANAMFVRPAG
jgi:FkbM family methyltransferase